MKVISILALGIVASTVIAQGHGNAGSQEGLRSLAPLLGTWIGKTTFHGPNGNTIEADTTVKITTMANRHYLRQDQVTVTPQSVSDSMNIISYEPRMGFFNAWWFFSSAASGPTQVRGKLDGKRLVMLSLEDPATTAPIFRRTINFEVANVLDDTLEMKQDGAWRTLFTVHYTKKQS